MKKLILYDHQGTKRLELDVYVEGRDFEWTSKEPSAYWLGRIALVDKELEPEPREAGEIVGDIEETAEKIIEVIEEEIPSKDVGCILCGWVGNTKDCRFGHDDFLCPECGQEALKEVMDEPEAVDNQSAGDRGSGEAGEHEDTKELPKKPARRKALKGDKHLRDRKTT